MADKDRYWLCYLAQGGHNVRVNVTNATLEEMQAAIAMGRPFGLWFYTDAGRMTGLIVNPVQGGLILNVDQAQAVPVTAQNTPAQTQQEVARWVEPKDQPIGEIHYPMWANMQADAIAEENRHRANGDGEHFDKVPDPPKPPTPPKTEPAAKPPGPPSQ